MSLYRLKIIEVILKETKVDQGEIEVILKETSRSRRNRGNSQRNQGRSRRNRGNSQRNQGADQGVIIEVVQKIIEVVLVQMKNKQI